MSKFYKLLSRDSKKEEEGIWIDIDAGDEKWGFKIAKLGKRNKKYLKDLERTVAPHRHALKHGLMDNDAQNNLYMGVFARSILLDWRGVVDEEDKPLKFSVENAIRLFEKLPYLFDQLEEDSQDVSLFREQQLKDESKN